MKFLEAMESLSDGKKVRPKAWLKGLYISVEETDEVDDTVVFNCEDVKGEWEFYEPLFDFPTAVKLLKAGGKVKRSDMSGFIYMNIEDDMIMWSPFGSYYRFSIDDFEAQDWQEWHEHP